MFFRAARQYPSNPAPTVVLCRAGAGREHLSATLPAISSFGKQIRLDIRFREESLDSIWYLNLADNSIRASENLGFPTDIGGREWETLSAGGEWG